MSKETEKYTGPVIDTHLHAYPIAVQGPPPVAVIVGEAANLKYDSREPWPNVLIDMVKNPRGPNPIWSPESDEELRDQTLAELQNHNVVKGVVSGTIPRVKDMQSRDPDRIIPALEFDFEKKFGDEGFFYTPEEVEKAIDDEGFKVFGEITDQYNGITPSDERFDPYWEVCTAKDVPVAIHIGVGPPGVTHMYPKFRAADHSPFTFERMLANHPNLRVWAMHAAWPMIDDLKAMLYTYPQLYIDTGSLQMAITRKEYYRFLENLVEAGFLDRIMFGSDQIVWPGLISEGIRAINDAPFLTMDQKKAILHDNAARFLRLDD